MADSEVAVEAALAVVDVVVAAAAAALVVVNSISAITFPRFDSHTFSE